MTQKKMRDKLAELIEKARYAFTDSEAVASFLVSHGVVVREKGEWVQGGTCEHKPYRVRNTDKWTTYKCSVCGYGNGRRFNTTFCPNCGADMRGETNDE